MRNRKIRTHLPSPAAAIANLGDDGLRLGFAAAIVNQNLGASLGKYRSAGAANAAGSSSYKSGLA